MKLTVRHKINEVHNENVHVDVETLEINKLCYIASNAAWDEWGEEEDWGEDEDIDFFFEVDEQNDEGLINLIEKCCKVVKTTTVEANDDSHDLNDYDVVIGTDQNSVNGIVEKKIAELCSSRTTIYEDIKLHRFDFMGQDFRTYKQAGGGPGIEIVAYKVIN